MLRYVNSFPDKLIIEVWLGTKLDRDSVGEDKTPSIIPIEAQSNSCWLQNLHLELISLISMHITSPLFVFINAFVELENLIKYRKIDKPEKIKLI